MLLATRTPLQLPTHSNYQPYHTYPLLVQTMTRMQTSKALLLTPHGPASTEALMEAAKSGAILDLEEQALAEELAAEASKA